MFQKIGGFVLISLLTIIILPNVSSLSYDYSYPIGTCNINYISISPKNQFGQSAYPQYEEYMKCLDRASLGSKVAILLQNNHKTDIVINQVYEDINSQNNYYYPMLVNCKYNLDKDHDGKGEPLIGQQIKKGEKFIIIVHSCTQVENPQALMSLDSASSDNADNAAEIKPMPRYKTQTNTLNVQFSMRYQLLDDTNREFGVQPTVRAEKIEKIAQETGLLPFLYTMSIILIALIALVIASGISIKEKKITLKNPTSNMNQDAK